MCLRAALVVLLFATVPVFGQRAPASSVPAMVVSQNAVASQVGAAALADGGNAVDAAVATAFALAVTHPTAGNVGGGGFIVLRLPDGRLTTFDFRECAPLASTPDMFLDENGVYSRSRHHFSHVAVGVPGTVAGLWAAHRRYGRRPWRDLVAPAVALARDGFVVTENLAESLAGMASDFAPYPASVAAFSKEGRPYRAGERLRLPELAATLLRIQLEGADGFYRGRTADLIVAEMQRGGGLITHEDLTRYRAVEREPVVGSYRGHQVVSMPPPSSGGITLINMLNMLESRPVERESTARSHLLAEIMRRGFADRARHLGDPDFNPPDNGLGLLAPAHGRAAIADFDPARASRSVLEGVSWAGPEGDQTTHLSVVDAEACVVSLTYTLEYGYGSRIVVPGAGFLLNNEMGDFNPGAGLTTEDGLIGTPPNLVAPGKRMLSSMTPTIVLDDEDRPVLVVGSPGGRTIINTVFQVIANVIDLGLDVQSAVDRGRLHHQWFPDRVTIEERPGTAECLVGLRERGHELRAVERMGAAECIQIDWSGGGPPRVAAGVDPRAADAGFARP